MAVQQQLDDDNHCKCPPPHQRKTLSQLDPTLRVRRFPKVRTGRLDHGWTGHFDNKNNRLLPRVFAEKPYPLLILLRICLTE